MKRIQVVEDSPTQAIAIAILLEDAGYEVAMAEQGSKALEAMRESPADIVLTDLNMPEMNGLELIKAVRKEFPEIPVIMMTADGTEEIAVEALNAGASSYIPKRTLDKDLLPTLEDIVNMLESRRDRDRVISAMVSSDVTFELANDHCLANALVGRLEEQLSELNFADKTGVFRIALGVKEALMNAIDHGNLELDSKLRDVGLGERYRELGKERMEREPYASRRVTLRAILTENEIKYVVRDDGPGFDPSIVPDPCDPENLNRPHGRGMMLIQSFMDSVSHNDQGNEITMIKRRNHAS